MTTALFPSMNGSAKISVPDSASGSVNGSTPEANGSTLDDLNHSQMLESVQQFFSHFNWNDLPPELHRHQDSSEMEDDPVSSLMLTVNQFLNSINWEGAPPSLGEGSLPADASLNLDDALLTDSSNEGFTLDDFSDLF